MVYKMVKEIKRTSFRCVECGEISDWFIEVTSPILEKEVFLEKGKKDNLTIAKKGFYKERDVGDTVSYECPECMKSLANSYNNAVQYIIYHKTKSKSKHNH